MKKKQTYLLLAACLLFTSCATGPPDVPRRLQTPGGRGMGGKIVVLPTRPGVKQRVLVVRPDGKARGSVLLFKGGSGSNPFSEVSHGFILGGNFLTRSAPLFARQGFIAVIVDTLSDCSGGFADFDRQSPKHIKDIQAVVSYLSEKGDTPIFLVGTSRGTYSVAYLAQKMTSEHVKGIVLTSSMDDIGLRTTKYPVLFVHHRDDGCFVTTYSNALQSYERVSSPQKLFVTVEGGKPRTGRECGPFAQHGFIGQESEVVKVITDWAQGKPVPDKVGP